MGEYWVEHYHVDGFRIDEFKGIDHWEFVQTFRDRTTAAHQKLFPSRPFLVVAEDTWRRPEIVRDHPDNPGGRKVVDSMWNFAYRDDVRRLARDRIQTVWGEPSRRDRIMALIGSGRTWDELARQFRDGFAELAQTVNYVTSHDVETEGEQRLMNQLFGELLHDRLGTGRVEPEGYEIGGVEDVRRRIASMPNESDLVADLYHEALDRVGSCFALLMTSVGIPMFLAGEEFADVHDLDHSDPRLKMSDPVDWRRREIPEHGAVESRVRELIHLRTSHAALQRTEVDFFYLHPTIDGNDGVRVFAYCRTGGRPLGSAGQVVVVANCGPLAFAAFDLPWPWAPLGQPREHGAPPTGAPIKVALDDTRATISLARFQVRVFET
jgi:1,4-alpha-glucan branching enzyme